MANDAKIYYTTTTAKSFLMVLKIQLKTMVLMLVAMRLTNPQRIKMKLIMTSNQGLGMHKD